MANEHDQALLRSAVADAGANLLDFVPSLGTGEVVGFGEGMPIPARFTFTHLQQPAIPHSEAAELAAGIDAASPRDFIRSVVDRWRGATRGEDASSAPEATVARDAEQSSSPVSRLLDDARLQILKR
jgi:hypothetical protein